MPVERTAEIGRGLNGQAKNTLTFTPIVPADIGGEMMLVIRTEIPFDDVPGAGDSTPDDNFECSPEGPIRAREWSTASERQHFDGRALLEHPCGVPAKRRVAGGARTGTPAQKTAT